MYCYDQSLLLLLPAGLYGVVFNPSRVSIYLVLQL